MIDKDFGDSVLKQEELLQMKKETGRVSVAGQVEMMTAISASIIELKEELEVITETIPDFDTSSLESTIESGLSGIKESIDNGFALVADAIKNKKEQ